MKKCFIFVVLAVVIMSTLSGCGKTTEDYLSEGKYLEAYEAATSEDEKEMVKAENTFAYLCNRISADVFGGEDVQFTLQSAQYIDGGKDLSEELFSGSYYYLMELESIDQTEQTFYVSYFHDTENNEFRNIFNALSLEENSSDDAVSAFWRQIVSWVVHGNIKASYELEPESLLRINDLISSDLIPDDIAVSSEMMMQN